MTNDELEELISNCPTLYHMAERGSWAAIRERGLLSTSALLDTYDVKEPTRSEIENEHRQNSVAIEADALPRAVIRDQMPMSDAGLVRCLPPHLRPADWYRILNSKVFFWLSEDRLHRLTGAKAYRDREHDVIEVDTRSLIEAHQKEIWLCPINSGCTKPMPRARDEGIFCRITDYPYSDWRKKRSKQERAVELCVDYGVHDIRDHVRRVIVKKATSEISVIE